MNATAQRIIEVPITVKAEEDTLISALASGNIGGPQGYAYWCAGLKLKGSRSYVDAERAAKSLLNGCDITVCEIEDERTDKITAHNLTREMFFKGFGRWAVECRTDGNTDEISGVTELDIDAPSSDMILQYAVFDAQKYG